MKKKKIFSLLTFFIITGFLLFPCFGFAANEGADKAFSSLNEAAVKGFGPDVTSGTMSSIPSAIGKVVGVALSFVGVIFLILMIYGGFLWMLARGNDADVTKAKDLIQSAVIGLVIVLAAYAITSFVGESLLK